MSNAFTPPTRASSISPRAIAWTASCNATKEDEQAVSIVMLGPRKSYTNEIPLDSMVNVPAVAVWEVAAARVVGSWRSIMLSAEVAPM